MPADSTRPAKLFAISPSNSADIPQGTVRCLLVETGGRLHYHDSDGNTVDVPNVAPGMLHAIEARRILETSDVGTIHGAV